MLSLNVLAGLPLLGSTEDKDTSALPSQPTETMTTASEAGNETSSIAGMGSIVNASGNRTSVSFSAAAITKKQRPSSKQAQRTKASTESYAEKLEKLLTSEARDCNNNFHKKYNLDSEFLGISKIRSARILTKF